jgi:hypothetical protein
MKEYAASIDCQSTKRINLSEYEPPVHKLVVRYVDPVKTGLKHIVMALVFLCIFTIPIAVKLYPDRYYLPYRKSCSRACFCNMNTINGAIEM